jgi:tRNA (guanine37-N1)-methyltransferase
MVEAISRLLPGVLGNERSASDDSFGGPAARAGAAGAAAPADPPPGTALVPDLGSFGRGPGDTAASMAGLLEGPVYTRPRVWRGREVPDVLLSGDHAAIARWRRDAALLRTAANRPDLIFRAAADPAALSERDWRVLTAMGLSDMIRSAGPGSEEAARLPGWCQTMAH